MPAHATHMSILDLVIDRVHQIDPDLGNLLCDNRDVAYLGSVAPDMYFLAPDISDGQRDLMYWLIDMYDTAIAPVVDLYENYIKPVEKALDEFTEPVDVVLDAVTCGALRDLGDDADDLVERAKQTMLTFLTELATNSVNLFQIFTPPIQEGKHEKEWFWFDMLHYRNTSDYVVKCVQSLPGPQAPKEKYEIGLAYAMGHLTHIAGDVTGHPYVNEIVGGPYRSHNRRHHIVENFIDVWTHDHYHHEELIGAKLHRKFTGGELLDTLGTLRAVAENALNPPDRLRDLFRYLEMAFQTTYGAVPHPTRLSSEYLTDEDISMSYWLSLAFLKMSTDCVLPPIEAPYDDLLEEINNQMEDLNDAVGDRPEPPDGPDMCWSFWDDDCDFSWDAFEDFVDFVKESIQYLGESIVWALNVLKELLELIYCTVVEALFLPIRALLWLIRHLLTELYNSFREALVVAGIALPSVDYLENSPLGAKFTTALGTWESFKLFPHRQPPSSLIGGLLFPDDSHLVHPSTSGEHDLTMSGPYLEGRRPTSFIEDAMRDQSLLDRFIQPPTPRKTWDVERDALQQDTSIGSAVDYAVDLIFEVYGMWKDGNSIDLPNWNLDGDRGYGYKCWNTKYPNSVLPDSVENVREKYIQD